MTNADIDAAIAAALSSDWSKALEINNKILSQNPEDLDCLNRIGKAYLELGDNKKAALTFKKVLKINKYDQIAQRNLARATGSSSPKKNNHDHKAAPQSSLLISFLEEPGKTKIVSLVNLAPTKTLLSLNNADPIQLMPKRHTVFVEDLEGSYLGALPDDLAHRLLILLKGGNKYEGFVKSCGKNSLFVFLKERTRAKKFHNTPSFPASGSDYLNLIREDSPLDETKHATPETEASSDNDSDDFSFSKNNLHQDEEEEET